MTATLASGCGGDGAAFGELLSSGPKTVTSVLGDPRFEVQIVYCQIDRKLDNVPAFTRMSYRAGGKYFYPASTVKLPVALVALEKLEALRADGIKVGLDSTLLHEAANDWQTAVTTDESSPSGLPSVGHYLRKIFIVSDNDAYNRLFELVGSDALANSLEAKGFRDVRIFHRLAVRREPWHGQYANPSGSSTRRAPCSTAARRSRANRTARHRS